MLPFVACATDMFATVMLVMGRGCYAAGNNCGDIIWGRRKAFEKDRRVRAEMPSPSPSPIQMHHLHNTSTADTVYRDMDHLDICRLHWLDQRPAQLHKLVVHGRLRHPPGYTTSHVDIYSKLRPMQHLFVFKVKYGKSRYQVTKPNHSEKALCR
jgi:hypothetical protein